MNKIIVEVYRKYDGIVGTASFTEEDIINMRDEYKEDRIPWVGYELENGVKGFSPKAGSYDGIICNNSFAVIYNGGEFHADSY